MLTIWAIAFVLGLIALCVSLGDFLGGDVCGCTLQSSSSRFVFSSC